MPAKELNDVISQEEFLNTQQKILIKFGESVSEDMVDQLYRGLQRSGATPFIDLYFTLSSFIVVSTPAFSYFHSPERVKRASLIEALILNFSLFSTWLDLCLIKNLIRDNEHLHMLKFGTLLFHNLLNELTSDNITVDFFVTRLRFYSEQMQDLMFSNARSTDDDNDFGTRIPHLLLYHLYTNPMANPINFQGNWESNLDEYFTFLGVHSTLSKMLNEKLSNYFDTPLM